MHSYKKGLTPDTDIVIWSYLDDRTSLTRMDKYYFYQNVWGAKMAFTIRPNRIVDIGSTALLAGVFSQLTETVALDIRPLPVSANNLICKKGSITDIPYPDHSVEYISSLCVIEHIGLGRYGDPVDSQGIEKAIAELRRVIRPGGYLVLSVPIGPPCVVFNAHRVFSRNEFLSMFPDFLVREEIFCVPEYTTTDPTPGMQKGQYHFYCVCFQKKLSKEEKKWENIH